MGIALPKNPFPETTQAVSSAFSNTVVAPITNKAQEILRPTEISQIKEAITTLEPRSYWDIDHYTVDGIDVPRYISEVKDPIAEVHFCTGFNSTPLVYAPYFDVMNELGLSVFATKLLQNQELGTEDPEELVQFHLKSTLDFFSSSRVKDHNKDVVKIGLTHSAAGGYVNYHTTDFQSLVPITNNFRGGFLHLAAFFDMANASKRFHPINHKIFMEFAKRNKELLTSDSVIGQGVSAYHRILKGAPPVFSADKEPTFGEILALRSISDTTIQRLEKSKTQPILRQRFALSTLDDASCSQTGGLVADLQGAEKTDYHASHNPQLEKQKNADRVTGRFCEMAYNAPTGPITEYTKPKPQATLEPAA